MLWEVEGLLGDSRANQADPLYVLSMDLAKCFDRLDLHTLNSICEKLQLSNVLVALKNYASLSRLFFLDGQPSDVWLQGSGITGIPQGCPLACFLCNLSSVAWHIACERAVPTALSYSYLDDRLLLVRSWQDLDLLLHATQQLDSALGPRLNLAKCARGVSQPPNKALKLLPASISNGDGVSGAHGLQVICLKRVFRYLGVDIRLRGGAVCTTSLRRFSDFKDRCNFVRMLPRHQRGAWCLSDAMGALWLAGGTPVTQQQLSKSVTAGFFALVGRAADGTVLRRSRCMMHVLGPGPHVSHGPTAIVYTWLRQWIRMRLLGRLSLDTWNRRWLVRARHHSGSLSQVSAALRWLGI